MGSVSSSPVSSDSSSIGIDSFGIGWIAADSSSHQLATKTASAVGEVSYCYASTGNSAGLSSSVDMDTSQSGGVVGTPVIINHQNTSTYGKHISGTTDNWTAPVPSSGQSKSAAAMWRFSIATKQQIAGFPTISDKAIFPTIVKPLISNKNVQNRPESEQFREMLGVFLFSKVNLQKQARARRWCRCPICRNISRENECSFLEIADGRNITRYPAISCWRGCSSFATSRSSGYLPGWTYRIRILFSLDIAITPFLTTKIPLYRVIQRG